MTNTDEFFAESKDVPRDRWGRYLLPPIDGGKPEGRTRATTFAKAIASTYNLSLWQQRMVAKGIAIRSDLTLLAAATPLSDKKTLDEIAERAKDAAGANIGRDQGTAVHEFTHQVMMGKPIDEVPDLARPAVEAYFRCLADNGIGETPRLAERVVLNQQHNVAGTFDRVWILPDGSWVIGDIKTSANIEYAWKEIAIQLALYADADAIMDYENNRYEDMPNVRKDFALVAHVLVDGLNSTCELYRVDLARGRHAAAICGQAREWNKADNLAVKWQPGVAPVAQYKDHGVPSYAGTTMRELRSQEARAAAAEDVANETPVKAEPGIDPETEIEELTKLTKEQLKAMAAQYGITDVKRYKRKVAADIVAAKNNGGVLDNREQARQQAMEQFARTSAAQPEDVETAQPDELIPRNPFADPAPTEAEVSYLDAIDKADSKAEIAAVWQQAIDNGDPWTDTLNAAAVERIAAISGTV